VSCTPHTESRMSCSAAPPAPCIGGVHGVRLQEERADIHVFLVFMNSSYQLSRGTKEHSRASDLLRGFFFCVHRDNVDRELECRGEIRYARSTKIQKCEMVVDKIFVGSITPATRQPHRRVLARSPSNSGEAERSQSYHHRHRHRHDHRRRLWG